MSRAGEDHGPDVVQGQLPGLRLQARGRGAGAHRGGEAGEQRHSALPDHGQPRARGKVGPQWPHHPEQLGAPAQQGPGPGLRHRGPRPRRRSVSV